MVAQSHFSISVTLVNRFLYCVSGVWKHSPNILKCGGKLPTPTTYTDACVYLALITNIIHQVESVLDLQHSNRHSYTRERTFTLYSTITLEAGVFHVRSPQKNKYGGQVSTSCYRNSKYGSWKDEGRSDVWFSILDIYIMRHTSAGESINLYYPG